MKKVPEIDRIIASIVDYQRLAKQLDKKIKKVIKQLTDELYAFDSNASKVKSEAEYLNLVKDLVISINKINEKANYGLIETMEREDIYTYIESVSTRLGFSFDYDITEEYREW
ncbi:MAG: hypothetical protein BGN88_02860 [Clostridiales bacterium 43-6]|nr:MAG: hypothetical protein BGN88_02860 [Clostridiales bacterium 43-6]